MARVRRRPRHDSASDLHTLPTPARSAFLRGMRGSVDSNSAMRRGPDAFGDDQALPASQRPEAPPDGVEISNWRGKAVAAPRTDFRSLCSNATRWDSLASMSSRVGPGDREPDGIHVGEAEVLRDRLKIHKSKDFWVTAVTFLSKDENLTKSHIRFLEDVCSRKPRRQAALTLDNSAASGSRLPEADRHDMEEFLEKIRQLLPVAGSELLTPVAAQQPPSSTGVLRNRDQRA